MTARPLATRFLGLSLMAVLISAGAVEARRRAAAADDLAWLAGCWESAEGDRIVQERWMEPRGGLLLGLSRTLEGGRTVAWEFMRVEESAEALLFVARPSGQTETTFVLSEWSEKDREFVFSNPDHDFPQRIIYRPGKDGSLHATVTGKENGKRRTIEIRMNRVRCEEGGGR